MSENRGTDEDVVLSGLSGNIEEFAKKLFDGVDTATNDGHRWPPGFHGHPKGNGKVNNLTHLDASFFGVNPKQADAMDPQLRILLEVTYEAIVDAGFNPDELRGSQTGVYVGTSLDSNVIFQPDGDSSQELIGSPHSMLPNRVSYTFDLKGPSYAINTACSNSTNALAHAFSDIRVGKCDAAIVAGANLCLLPAFALAPEQSNLQSSEDLSAAFDVNGRNYVRSKAVVAVLLQRRRDCRRLYCTVHGVRTNADGYKTQGITAPLADVQLLLALETFKEARLRPQDVVYLETQCTGTNGGDPEEINAIAELYCEGRNTPLLIGSVKSNTGHSGAAAGLCCIAKLVLAMEHGVIPGNLHFSTPNPDIPALSDGRIKVVDCNTAWPGGLVAVNSFGLGGAHAHVILESHSGERPSLFYPVPRLVLASGRTEAAVLRLLKLAADHPQDAELHALLDAVHAKAIPCHTYRGYALLNHKREASPISETMKIEATEPRPIWFVFNGLGSQRPGMMTLMQLPVFAASIERMAAALRPMDFDLLHVLSEDFKVATSNMINSSVLITAVQVALVDVLNEAGVHPDGIVGFSIGENGCAYADGCLTAEQVILTAYWRARIGAETKIAPGMMGAVGLTWEETERRCPPGVFPACHIAEKSVTVSGLKDSVEEFIAKLESEQVFARRINSGGKPYHTKYVAPSLPQIRSKLLEIMPKPRPRSARWISSSLSPAQRDSEWGKLCSVEYQINNIISPVMFANALRAIPEIAIVVEIIPHSLFKPLLSGTHVPLIGRDHPDPLMHLLQALGRLYAAGAQPRVSSLYPPVPWPVSRGSPSLASAIEWDHSME